MAKRTLWGLALLASAPAAAEQEISSMHFVPAARSLQTAQFNCNDANGRSIDAEAKYGAKKNGSRVYESGVYEISFGGQRADRRTLAKLAEIVGDASVVGVEGQCQPDGQIQLVFELYRYRENGGKGKRDWAIVLLDENREIDVYR